MEFVFQRGVSTEPKGHALVYFRNKDDELEVLSTYLVVSPVPLKLAKYMPPMFAARMPASDIASVSAIPLPPIPEKVESEAFLRRLAEAREDDLIYCGLIDPADIERSLTLVSEAAQRYLQLYNDYIRDLPPLPTVEEPLIEVSDVIYSLMSEKQRLAELAKLTGKLRYAVEGGDVRLIKETVEEMRALARHMPEKYRVTELIDAAQIPGPRGERLSQLYVNRSYLLSEEDYEGLQKIDEEIETLRG